MHIGERIFGCVASFTDAWIETYSMLDASGHRLVASFTDAWIETCALLFIIFYFLVASFTDAWIETNDKDSLEDKERSHLLQMRGLKQVLGSTYKLVRGRIFYRCVD